LGGFLVENGVVQKNSFSKSLKTKENTTDWGRGRLNNEFLFLTELSL